MHSNVLEEIEGLVEGRLIRRVNRFVIEVDVNSSRARAHLRDSGRLSELMKEGNTVLMREKTREKTQFEVFVVYDGDKPVIVNSSLHSILGARVLEMLGYKIVKKEVKLGDSRIDLLAEKDEKEIFVEIKGCTLVKKGTALFPDAPTERGVKHVKKITEVGGMILFLVMREDARRMMPNVETHPEFASVLRNAVEKGVDVRAALLKPLIKEDKLSIKFKGCIPLIFPDL